MTLLLGNSHTESHVLTNFAYPYFNKGQIEKTLLVFISGNVHSCSSTLSGDSTSQNCYEDNFFHQQFDIIYKGL